MTKKNNILEDLLNEDFDDDLDNYDKEPLSIDKILEETKTILPEITLNNNYRFNPNINLESLNSDIDRLLLEESEQIYNINDSTKYETNTILNQFISEVEQSKEAKAKEVNDKKDMIHKSFLNKNPIEFINYRELEMYKTIIEENKNVFVLKNFKNHKTLKLSVIESDKKKKLSSKLYLNPSNSSLITSISVNEEVIIAGNNLGCFKLYNSLKEEEYKSYTMKEIENCEKRSVVCMDISFDGEFLIAGYSNGYLALWNLSTSKCVKLVNNSHKSCVVAVKFLRNDKKKFEIIASDIDGEVIKYVIKEGIFSTSVEIKPLIKNESAAFIINILRLSENDKKVYPELAKSLIVALGSLEYILVIMLEPEGRKLFKLEKPKYVKDNYVPDSSFGIGYIPTIENQESDGNQSNNNSQNIIDYSKKQILLSISWDRYIYVYVIPIYQSLIHPFVLAGHYYNLTPIVRMGFLSDSIIFFFDSKKQLKVINSSLIKTGDVIPNYDFESFKYYSEEFKKADLQEEREIDQDIIFQTYIIDKNEKNKTKATYVNTIIYRDRLIYILAKKDFYQVKLLNWKEVLEKLYQKSEWMEALTLGLDIYYGRITALPDIPLDETFRKLQIGFALKNLINQYALTHTGNEYISEYIRDKSYQDRIELCINTCIEFCIEINSVEYLLNDLQPIFDRKGLGLLFIEKLEPFILCDKISNEKLQQFTISRILDLYLDKKQYNKLSKVLVHLDIRSIDIEQVRMLCNDYNLINPYIYIYTNGSNEDFFSPITKIFEVFESAKEIPNFVSYSDSIDSPDLESSKQYTGHKLLWYINLCLNGKRFPKKDDIPEYKIKKTILLILTWFLSEEVFLKLLTFDPKSVFSILKKIIEDDNINKIMKEEDESSISSLANENKISFRLKNLAPITIVNHIVAVSKGLSSRSDYSSIIECLYEFIVKLSKYQQMLQFQKSILVEAAKYLLSMHFDFSTEPKRQESQQFIEKNTEALKDMIDNRDDFDNKDFQVLLGASETSQFILVKIHLLKKTKNFRRCLEVFLKSELIVDKSIAIFDWIDETLREFSDDDDKIDLFDSLKEETLNRLPDLANISIERVTDTVENWFKNDQHEIVRKLDKLPKLQLKYVEKVIEKSKDDIESYLTKDSYSGNNNKFEYFSEIMKLHILLLCQYNKKEVVGKLEQRISLYPIDECLKICLDYKVHDAAIFLMSFTGAVIDALKLSINIINESFNNIITNLTSVSFNENKNYTYVDEMKTNIKKTVELCEKNSSKLEGKEEDLWFPLLEQFYKIAKMLKEKFKPDLKAEFDDLNKRISQEIRDLLEKMCSYVSIQLIIDNVTNNYKDAEFKEFKKLLLKMLSSYSHQKNILNSAKNLLGNSILYNEIELKKLNSKGKKYELYKCDGCNFSFNHISEEIFILFGCGHIYHFKCIYPQDLSDVSRYLCLKKDYVSAQVKLKNLVEKIKKTNLNRDQLEDFLAIYGCVDRNHPDCPSYKKSEVCGVCLKNEVENKLIVSNQPSLVEQFKINYNWLNSIDEKQKVSTECKKIRNDIYFNRLKAIDKYQIEQSSMLLYFRNKEMN